MQVGTLRTLTILFIVLFVSGAGAADDKNPPDVQSLMTAEDYAASGLDKLSDAERKHLSEWVERYREGAVIGPVVKKKPSQMDEEEKVEYQAKKKEQEVEIVAKVIPVFRGWSGKTIFRLDNGQTWRQRTPGRFKYSGSDSTVVLTRNFLGKYIMKHQDTGRGIGVTRID